MFGLGFTELLLIMIVALVVFGPQRLPEIAKTLGKTMGELRRAMDEIRYDLSSVEQELQQRDDSRGGAPGAGGPTVPGASSQTPELPSSALPGPQAVSLVDTCEAEKLNKAGADSQDSESAGVASAESEADTPPVVDSSTENKES